MIDGIKLHVRDEMAKFIYFHKELNFSTKVNIETGEILINEVFDKAKTIKYETIIHTASYLNVLTFTYKQTIATNLITKVSNEYTNLEITGSFHKLHNNGRNDSDFTFIDFVTVICKFSKKFGVNPIYFEVVNLEFGVNIQLPLKASEFISNIVFYKTIRPDVDTFYDRGYMKRFKLSQYIIKVYDKGLQNKTIDNQLRFEIKAIKNQYLQFANIKYLVDLLKYEVWEKLSIHLLQVFNQLLIYEKLNTLHLSNRQILFYTNSKNSDFWHKVYNRSKYTFKDNRKMFRAIINKYGNCQQKNIAQLMKDKCDSLIDCNNDNHYTLFRMIKKWKSLPPIFTNLYLPTENTLPSNFTNNFHITSITFTPCSYNLVKESNRGVRFNCIIFPYQSLYCVR